MLFSHVHIQCSVNLDTCGMLPGTFALLAVLRPTYAHVHLGLSTSFYPWCHSHEEMYQALPALPYCKWRKAGRGTGYEARKLGIRICIMSLTSRPCVCEYLHGLASLSLRVRSWDKDVDYAYCSTPHVAAIALQALKAPLACTLASGYARLYCRVVQAPPLINRMAATGLAVIFRPWSCSINRCWLCSLFDPTCSSASPGGNTRSSTKVESHTVA